MDCHELIKNYECFEGNNCLHLYRRKGKEEDVSSTGNLELVPKDSEIREVYSLKNELL